jgi:glycosyltransferase involved in cell wall biosynthesis
MALVADERKPQIGGAVHGDPFDRATWSGISYHLFTALDDAGVLAGAVSAVPPRAFDLAARAAAFHPRRRRWVERYEVSPLQRRFAGATARRRVQALGVKPDATLQVGAWYDLGASATDAPLRASYHDSNLALYLREHDWFEDPEARHVRATMRAEQRVYDGLDVILTVSEWLRDSFVADFGQPDEKVVTVGLGANVPALPSEPARDWDVPRLLFVGFDWLRKGGEDVLAAFARLRDHHPGAELWVVGPDPRPPVPGVTWHGRIDRRTASGDERMAELHRRATMFVMPSHYDPMPNVFLEAMAYRLPCVGADAGGGTREMIDDGRTGLLVPRRDPGRLAEALLALAADPARARAFGRAGYDRLVGRFTWDLVAGRMIDAIGDRVERRRGAAAVTSS